MLVMVMMMMMSLPFTCSCLQHHRQSDRKGYNFVAGQWSVMAMMMVAGSAVIVVLIDVCVTHLPGSCAGDRSCASGRRRVDAALLLYGRVDIKE